MNSLFRSANNIPPCIPPPSPIPILGKMLHLPVIPASALDKIITWTVSAERRRLASLQQWRHQQLTWGNLFIVKPEIRIVYLMKLVPLHFFFKCVFNRRIKTNLRSNSDPSDDLTSASHSARAWNKKAIACRAPRFVISQGHGAIKSEGRIPRYTDKGVVL